MRLKINKNIKDAILMVLYLFASLVGTRTIHAVAFIIFVLFTGSGVFRKDIYKFLKGSYIKTFIIFAVFVLISYFWADHYYFNLDIALVIVLGLTEQIYMYLFLSRKIFHEWNVDFVLKIYVAYVLMLALYLLIFTPKNIWTDEVVRVGSNLNINRNIIGMLMAYSSIICFYFIKKTKHKLLPCSLIVIMGTICLLTGSRKGTIILIGGIIGYMILSSHSVKLIRNIFLAVGLLVLAWIVIRTNETLYAKVGVRFEYLISSILNDGDTVESSLNTRAYYRTTALMLWRQRPIIGHGFNGFMTYMYRISYWHVAYSHCNYTEMLADYGVIGFALYYIQRVIMLFRIGIKRMINNKTVCLLWVCALIMIVMEYGCVTYYSLPLQIIYIILTAVFNYFTFEKVGIRIKEGATIENSSTSAYKT